MTTIINEDPFLCPECSKVGYCIRKAQNNMPATIEKPFTEMDIINMVPVKSSGKDSTGRFGKKLQAAHDLFHQNEYEQASYLYQDMLEWRNDCDEVKIGLTAAFYFLKKYEEAVGVAHKINGPFHDQFTLAFVELCAMKTKESNVNLESKAPAVDSFSKVLTATD